MNTVNGWIDSNIQGVTLYQTAGGTPSVSNEKFYNGNIPFVIIEDITKSFKFLDLTVKFLSDTGIKNSAAWEVGEGHVLYSMYATVGKPIINRIKCATNQAIIALKPDNNIDIGFLYYSLVFIEPDVYKYTAQTTQSNLNAGVVRKLPIRYPKNIQEQHKIATILTSIDTAIEKTEALIHKYQRIKAGLMHDLFTRGVTADGKLRPPREQAPELYKETPIGWVPKDWQFGIIGEVVESLVDGPFGSNLKTEHYVSGPGIRVVRLQNIQTTKYNDNDKAFVSNKHADSLIRNKVVSGDILIAGLGEDRYPVGRACLYPDNMPPAINKADCFRLRCNSSEMLNAYMMFYLNTASARKQIKKYEQGVTRPRINTGNFKKVLFLKPEIEEQRIVVKRLMKVISRIEHEDKNKEKLLLEKQGLMQDLLTGKVRVKVDQPESANV